MRYISVVDTIYNLGVVDGYTDGQSTAPDLEQSREFSPLSEVNLGMSL